MAAEFVVRHAEGHVAQATRIIDEFSARTGLRPEVNGSDIRFAMGPGDHEVPLVRTLNEIDPSWPEHLLLVAPEE